jgi:hypothetical protein
MGDDAPNPDLKVEIRDDGSALFELRDGFRLLARWASAKQIRIEIWHETLPVPPTPPEDGNINTSAFREKLVHAARERFGKDQTPNLAEDIGKVATALGAPQKTGKSLHEELEELSGPNITERLILYARKSGTFFHDSEEDAYASVQVKDHVETYPVRARKFRLWLQGEFMRREQQRIEDEAAEQEGALYESRGFEAPVVVRTQNLNDAIGHLEAVSLFKGHQQEVNLRVAGHEDRIYLDLCDQSWRVAEVSVDGWQIIPGKDAPVRFIRPKGMAPLPLPDRENASLEPLRKLLNLAGDDTEEHERSWRLILAWLVAALRPTGPYAVMVLQGQRGSAKSTAARILRSLVDPSTVPLRTPPRNPHDLYIDAISSWTISLDNISKLPPWLSDALCMLSTGGGYTTRMLFTGREQELFEAMRPAILNGINSVATADDLSNRSLLVPLPVIERNSYKTERVIQRNLAEIRPAVLAALLDASVVGLQRIDETEGDAIWPRLGDFAAWAVATEEALGGERDSFKKALGFSEKEAAQQALEASPLFEPLYNLAKANSPAGWESPAKELLEKLNDDVDEDLHRDKEWPKAPNSLSRKLNRLAPLARDADKMHIEQLSRSDEKGSKPWLIRLL